MHAAVHQVPATPSMAAARDEAEMVMFDSVHQVLQKHKVSPKQVGWPALLQIMRQ